MTEMDILRSIRLALSELGYCVFRINSGKLLMADGRWFETGVPKGFSDLFAVKDGKAFFIEVKTEHGRPTAEQLNFIKQMREKYGTGIVPLQLPMGKEADFVGMIDLLNEKAYKFENGKSVEIPIPEDFFHTTGFHGCLRKNNRRF